MRKTFDFTAQDQDIHLLNTLESLQQTIEQNTAVLMAMLLKTHGGERSHNVH
jgi:hypothetical protein